MILLKNARVFVDNEFSEKDLLITERIEEIGNSIDAPFARTLDLDGSYVLPGFIDIHCHVNGAGGEGGPMTRTFPVDSPSLLSAGTTTVVGLLGTDGYTRSPVDLLMHVRRLNQRMDAYMLTGSYQVPGPTITGSVANDIILIPEVVGVKMALSDHRSSYPGYDLLRSMATQVRVSSMISGKRTMITVHMGDGKDMFTPILDLVERTEIPLWHFIPTHIDRNEDLLRSSVEYGRRGGYLDITAHEGKTLKTIEFLTGNGVPLDNITVSTDGNGSMPIFDERGMLIRLDVSPLDTLLRLLRESISRNFLKEFLRTVTENPARRLGLKKGRISVGMDADLIVFDGSWNLRYSISRGRLFSP
ncbi:MAG: amidohydrolase family protein [Thermoplasmata archaeon]|nr:beta-aspartyl-peptidase [Thermoplasmatales archaeon]